MKFILEIIAYFLILSLVILVFATADQLKDARLDIQCKTRYGAEWSYYGGRAADCVNNNGEGKLLK